MFKLLAIILVAQGVTCDHPILGTVTLPDAMVRIWRTEDSFKLTVTNLQDIAIDNHISYHYYCESDRVAAQGVGGVWGAGGICGEFFGPYADQFPLLPGRTVQFGSWLTTDPTDPFYSNIKIGLFTCDDPRVEIYEHYQEDDSHEAWIEGYNNRRQLTTSLIIDPEIRKE